MYVLYTEQYGNVLNYFIYSVGLLALFFFLGQIFDVQMCKIPGWHLVTRSGFLLYLFLNLISSSQWDIFTLLVPTTASDLVGFHFSSQTSNCSPYFWPFASLIKSSPVDLDLDACLTSVHSISKSLVKTWIVAIRILIFQNVWFLPYFPHPPHLEKR